MAQLTTATGNPPRAEALLHGLFAQPALLVTIVACVTAIVIAWLWRRRKAEYASKRSLYGSWHAAIPRYRRSLHRLTAELERARRYHHSLAIAVLSVDVEQHRRKNSSLVNLMGNAEIASQFFFSLVSSMLRDNVRGSDLVTYDVTSDHYVLLFPEAKLANAEQTLQRLKKIVLQRSKVLLRFGIAEYPGEGLILQDLVGLALARSQRTASDAPQIEAAPPNGQLEQRQDALAEPVSQTR
jgi:GGDEF domain-containing protein